MQKNGNTSENEPDLGHAPRDADMGVIIEEIQVSPYKCCMRVRTAFGRKGRHLGPNLRAELAISSRDLRLFDIPKSEIELVE